LALFEAVWYWVKGSSSPRAHICHCVGSGCEVPPHRAQPFRLGQAGLCCAHCSLSRASASPGLRVRSSNMLRWMSARSQEGSIRMRSPNAERDYPQIEGKLLQAQPFLTCFNLQRSDICGHHCDIDADSAWSGRRLCRIFKVTPSLRHGYGSLHTWLEGPTLCVASEESVT